MFEPNIGARLVRLLRSVRARRGSSRCVVARRGIVCLFAVPPTHPGSYAVASSLVCWLLLSVRRRGGSAAAVGAGRCFFVPPGNVIQRERHTTLSENHTTSTHWIQAPWCSWPCGAGTGAVESLDLNWERGEQWTYGPAGPKREAEQVAEGGNGISRISEGGNGFPGREESLPDSLRILHV